MNLRVADDRAALMAANPAAFDHAYVVRDLLADRTDMLAKIARLRNYVGDQDVMSDYCTAADMRTAIDRYRTVFGEVNREAGRLMGILEAIIVHGVDPQSKPVRDAVDVIRKRWEAKPKA